MSEIRFTSEDVRRLYGDRFFVLPELETGHQNQEPLPVEEPEVAGEDISIEPPEAREPVAAPEVAAEAPLEKPAEPENTPVEQPEPEPPVVSPFARGPEVAWKMRPTAHIALVMSEEEFANRGLTVVLKDCVVRAGLDTGLIGFGVLKGKEGAWDFRSMPVGAAVVFRHFEGQDSPQHLESGTLHLFFSVTEVVLDPGKQEMLISLLKKIVS